MSHTLTPLEISLQREAQKNEGEAMLLDSQDFNMTDGDPTQKKPNDDSESVEQPAKKKLKTTEVKNKQNLFDAEMFLDGMMPSFDSQLFRSLNSQNENVSLGASEDQKSVPNSEPAKVQVTVEALKDDSVMQESNDADNETNNSKETEHTNQSVGQTVDDPPINLPEESSQAEIATVPKHLNLQEDATIFSSQV